VEMGSLSDLSICKMNDRRTEQSEVSSVNTNIHAHLDNIRKACAELSAYLIFLPFFWAVILVRVFSIAGIKHYL